MKITKRQLRKLIKEYEFPGSIPAEPWDPVKGYPEPPEGMEGYFDNTVSKSVYRPIQDPGAAQSAQPQPPGSKVEVEWDLGNTEFKDMPYDQAIEAAGLPSVVELPAGFDEDEASDWLSDEYGYTLLGTNPVNEGRKMRITKRQLKRMILEAMPHGGAPDVVGATTGVPGGNIQNLVDEYKAWAVEYMGTPSGANSSSVLATFLVDRGLDQGAMADNIMKDISREMRFDIVDVRRAVSVAREEYDAGGVLSEPEDLERGFKESTRNRGRLLTEDSIMRVEEQLFTAIDEFVQVMDEELGYDVPLDQLKAEVLNMVDGAFEQFERDQKDEDDLRS
jgi:hypothetical protein